MSNEISASCALSVSKGGASISASGSFNADMAGSEMLASVQTIAASSTQISIGGCDQVEFLLIKNLDATNYVDIALDTGFTQIIGKIKAGKCGFWSGVSTTLYAKANTGALDIFVAVCES